MFTRKHTREERYEWNGIKSSHEGSRVVNVKAKAKEENKSLNLLQTLGTVVSSIGMTYI